MRLSVGPVLDLELGQLDRQVHNGDGDDLRFPLETQRGAQTETKIFGEKHINASKQVNFIGPLHRSTDGTPDQQTFYTLIILGGKFSLRPV